MNKKYKEILFWLRVLLLVFLFIFLFSPKGEREISAQPPTITPSTSPCAGCPGGCYNDCGNVLTNCPGGGGYCVNNSSKDCRCVTHDIPPKTECLDVGCTAYCPPGYSYSCPPGSQCTSCTVTCQHCNNTVTCYKVTSSPTPTSTFPPGETPTPSPLPSPSPTPQYGTIRGRIYKDDESSACYYAKGSPAPTGCKCDGCCGDKEIYLHIQASPTSADIYPARCGSNSGCWDDQYIPCFKADVRMNLYESSLFLPPSWYLQGYSCCWALVSNQIQCRPINCSWGSILGGEMPRIEIMEDKTTQVDFFVSQCPLSSPTNLSGSCDASSQVTLSWDPVDGAEYYPLRVDTWGDGLDCSPNSSDLCIDDLESPFYSFQGVQGGIYHWWVHSWNSRCGWSEAADGGWISCPSPSSTSTPTPLPQGWFQTQEGDVYGSRISSNVPSSQSFSLDGTGGFPGIVIYKTSKYFGSGNISSKNWLVNVNLTGEYYDYFYSLAGSPSLIPPPPGGKIFSNNLPNKGILAYSGSIQTGDVWNVGSKKVVIFTTGNFLINHSINIGSGGSLIVVAKGEGSGNRGIGVASSLEEIMGIFVTDKYFYSSVAAEDLNLSLYESFVPLTINGVVIAKEGGNFTREVENVPAEKFVYNSDIVWNALEDIWPTSWVWEEVAP